MHDFTKLSVLTCMTCDFQPRSIELPSGASGSNFSMAALGNMRRLCRWHVLPTRSLLALFKDLKTPAEVHRLCMSPSEAYDHKYGDENERSK